jgi:hypothetical protein
VKLPNDSMTFVTHIGTVTLLENLTLTGVLCVPSFTFNLIFARKLIKNLRCCPIFFVGYCFIQSLYHWRTIGVGKEEASLFYLLQKTKVSTLAASTHSFHYHISFNSIKLSSHDVWHYRLGHPLNSRIRLLHEYVLEIYCKPENVCPICPMAKQHKLPFHLICFIVIFGVLWPLNQ